MTVSTEFSTYLVSMWYRYRNMQSQIRTKGEYIYIKPHKAFHVNLCNTVIYVPLKLCYIDNCL